MKKFSLVIVALFTLIAVGLLINVTYTKAKYLEKKEVVKTMIQWNKALGVECSFCHTKDRGQTYQSLAGKTVDGKDLKALVHQRIARAMLGTMLYVNKKENKNYTCNTCHQGKKEVEVK